MSATQDQENNETITTGVQRTCVKCGWKNDTGNQKGWLAFLHNVTISDSKSDIFGFGMCDIATHNNCGGKVVRA